METIILHDVAGYSSRVGIDQYNNPWCEFEVDYMADQEDGECNICGACLDSGWMCLYGGEEVCGCHVIVA